VPERRAAAAAFGIETLDLNETQDIASTLIEAVSGRGPDAVIDAVGMEAHGHDEARASKLAEVAQKATGLLPDRVAPDVAKKVGVSEATVSRVLNGKAGVSDSTREAVLTALDVLGYERPTQLRGERARLIGLVLPELQNPIFPALAEVIGGALAQRGFTPVLCTRTAGGLSEADYVGMLLDQHVSGMVFFGGHCAEANAPHEHYRQLRSRGIPVVLLNAAIDDQSVAVVSVVAVMLRRMIDARDGSRTELHGRNGPTTLVTFMDVAGREQKASLSQAYAAQLVDMEAAGVAAEVEDQALDALLLQLLHRLDQILE